MTLKDPEDEPDGHEEEDDDKIEEDETIPMRGLPKVPGKSTHLVITCLGCVSITTPTTFLICRSTTIATGIPPTTSKSPLRHVVVRVARLGGPF